MTPELFFSPEVKAALSDHRPVVALESTVISHGLPRPQNLELARRMEAVVREQGAVPATIAILKGQVKIGLTDEELTYLANADGVWKVSRRDFPVVAVRKADGATTVAGTMIGAAWAGIKVFATGGIGGVHHGDHTDVSADLPELSRTSVAVVCAGAKAILDLPATLEWLETAGVPVIGYGTNEFPAFYTRTSGLKLEASAESAAEVAAMINTKWQMGLAGGVLITAPIPTEAALPSDSINDAIEQALAAAGRQGIKGKAVTPFLLAKVAEITGGASLRANIALLENNARVAAEIARNLGSSGLSVNWDADSRR
ncbi:MAG: pseudouridine-5'-phosphate glycosidase [Chloroflexi bacterium]|nr:pseudouridine-5'-phosphate glycosidase [Chloroflexota bacterium]